MINFHGVIDRQACIDMNVRKFLEWGGEKFPPFPLLPTGCLSEYKRLCKWKVELFIYVSNLKTTSYLTHRMTLAGWHTIKT